MAVSTSHVVVGIFLIIYRRIAGVFRTSPIEALQLLTRVPPLHITI